MDHFFVSHGKVRRFYEAPPGVDFDAVAYVQRPGAVKEGTPFFLDLGMRPAEPLCSFFLELSKSLKAKSLEDYTYDALDLVDFLGQLPVPTDLVSATEDDLVAYREDCTEHREAPDKPATWRKRRSLINNFYDWAVDARLLARRSARHGPADRRLPTRPLPQLRDHPTTCTDLDRRGRRPHSQSPGPHPGTTRPRGRPDPSRRRPAHHPNTSTRRSHLLMPVSAKTATKLREAMARLLAGEPLHTDGALTKENLAREAQVSHATVHRADDILAEWNAKVARPVLRTPGEVARDETIAELRRQLRKARAEITQLNGELDALATVTANLYHENLALKKKLGSSRRLTSLHPQE